MPGDAMTGYERLLDALEAHGVRVNRSKTQQDVKCVNHDDKTASLSIGQGRKGAVIDCKAGCETEKVVARIGLNLADVFDDKTKLGSRVVKEYSYCDEHGGELSQTVRLEPKGFRQRRPDGNGGWVWDMKGVRRVLYRLPDVISAVAEDRWVVIVEGEKDADRLRQEGFVATTSPMGAKHWSKVETGVLDGAKVAVIPDNDEPGHSYVAAITSDLYGKAAALRVINLPDLPNNGDASDWLNRRGTADQLRTLVENAPDWEPISDGDDPGDQVSLYEVGGVIFDTPAIPEALWGAGSEVLAAMGEATLIHSATGIGKTTLAQRIALASIGIGPAEVLGYPVRQIEGRLLYVAADRPAQAKRSMRRMVTTDDRCVLDGLLVWESHRRLRITPEHPEAIYEAAIAVGATLVILDSVKDLVAQVATDEAGQTYNDAVQTCVANGVEVIALHHPRKPSSDGRTTLTLSDVYGSTWITAGAGSVITLDGNAGEGVAKLRQLKMPAEKVGPFDIDFDYDTGSVSTIGRRDLTEWFARVKTGTTAEATQYLLGKPNATPVEKKKVRRKLIRLEEDGYLTRSSNSGEMTVWRWVGLALVGESTQGGRSGVGQGGRSPTRSGSVTEDGNVDTAGSEGVGQGAGQGRSQGSVNPSPS